MDIAVLDYLKYGSLGLSGITVFLSFFYLIYRCRIQHSCIDAEERKAFNGVLIAGVAIVALACLMELIGSSAKVELDHKLQLLDVRLEECMKTFEVVDDEVACLKPSFVYARLAAVRKEIRAGGREPKQDSNRGKLLPEE